MDAERNYFETNRDQKMKSFIVYNVQGKILRTGFCQDKNIYGQAGEAEFVMEGEADDITQKVINVGIKGKIVDKTPEEIEADNPKPIEIPVEKQLANITNEQWQDVLDRFKKLEAKA